MRCDSDSIFQDADGQIHIVKVEVEAVEPGFPEKYIVTSHNTDGSANGVRNGAQVSTHLTETPHRCLAHPFVFDPI